ncbi:TIGR04255 family protein [Spirosoma endophyticum]|uniref:TIGR04255 family protein n=1 Tax=Spirosoma endophyticum TaxID=662367 RepID=A0A1I1SQX3_9BACT|nr:TIGR04255 family protein [Spirosoma endophyticum]SFD46283.1 TIGR04255 family protein [Spirosoma endophyticum]
MMFGFPKSDRSEAKTFTQNFLRQVIWQVKFASNDLIATRKDGIVAIMKDLLPQLNTSLVRDFEIKEEADGPVFKPKTPLSPAYELKSEDGQKMLSVDNESITYIIQGPAYKNFENLNAEIDKISGIFSLCEISVFNRIAIRKINMINFAYKNGGQTPSIDFSSYMISANAGVDYLRFPNRQLIQQSIHSVSYVSDAGSMNLKYGLIVPEINNNSGEYVIDIDIFKQSQVKVDELEASFLSINDEIFNVFNWVISDTAKLVLKQNDHTPTNS